MNYFFCKYLKLVSKLTTMSANIHSFEILDTDIPGFLQYCGYRDQSSSQLEVELERARETGVLEYKGIEIYIEIDNRRLF